MAKGRRKKQKAGSSKKWKHEWHLYSAAAIAAAPTFIAIQYFSGTPKDIGIAFSAIVATFLFTSGNWKELPAEVHQWSIGIALITTLIVGLLFVPLIHFFTVKDNRLD